MSDPYVESPGVAVAEPATVPPPDGFEAGDAYWHARQMLAALGIPCDDESTAHTPARLVRALRDMTWGMREDPARHLARTFPVDGDDAGMIAVPGIGFTSLCEHHVLPFTGTATVAYIPAAGARVVGLSKMPRLVQGYAARPQMQERLGRQILDAITQNLDTIGAAVTIRSVHTCMTLRGPRVTGAEMVTDHLAGVFKADPAVRAEFLDLARR